MYKLTGMVALFFCMNALGAGSVNLAGTIKKSGGEAIHDARVSLINNPSIVAVTDANGAFTLTGTDTSAAQSDSLVVITKGYRTVLVAAESYQKSDIAITQTPSNTWIPSEPVEHSGGMVKIKAKGYDFEMGQPCDTVRGVYFGMPTSDAEVRVHTVSFTYDFWMDTVEVRQGEYDSLMKLTYGTKYVRPTWNTSNGLGKNWAAYSIEWGSAALFCNARSKCQGLPDTAYSYSGIIGTIGVLCTLQNVSVNLHANAYRLPTEAEWEYACRAGTTSDYYWGKNLGAYPANASDTAEMNGYAIWDANSFGLGKDKIIQGGPGLDSSYYGTHETGKKKPNAYGLYDMSGNLSEWCNDWLNYYAWGAATDPTGIALVDSGHGALRVRRGGNWSNNATYLRSTERLFYGADYEFLFCGFRVASSGITTGIIKTDRLSPDKQPSIKVSSGRIRWSNAAGCIIGIYSLSGKRLFSAQPDSRQFSYAAASLPAGSYIARIRSTNETTRLITLLPR